MQRTLSKTDPGSLDPWVLRALLTQLLPCISHCNYNNNNILLLLLLIIFMEGIFTFSSFLYKCSVSLLAELKSYV
jgi:hypothetical protein